MTRRPWLGAILAGGPAAADIVRRCSGDEPRTETAHYADSDDTHGNHHAEGRSACEHDDPEGHVDLGQVRGE